MLPSGTPAYKKQFIFKKRRNFLPSNRVKFPHRTVSRVMLLMAKKSFKKAGDIDAGGGMAVASIPARILQEVKAEVILWYLFLRVLFLQSCATRHVSRQSFDKDAKE